MNRPTSPHSDFPKLASALLAAVLQQLFPQVELREPIASHFTFGWSFYLPKQLTESDLEWLNHHMRRLQMDPPALKAIETTPQSACGYLETHGQPCLARKISALSAATIRLLQIGELWLPLSLGTALQIGDLRHFQLLDVENSGRETRLVGAICESSRELKRYLKAVKRREREGHLAVGEERQFWCAHRSEEGAGIIWLPSGLSLQNRLKSDLESARREWGGVQVYLDSGALPQIASALRQLRRERGWESIATWGRRFPERFIGDEGVLTPSLSHGEMVYTAVKKGELRERLESCLRFIEEWSKIRDLDGWLVGHYGGRKFSPPAEVFRDFEINWSEEPSPDGRTTLSFRALDGLGRDWEMGRVTLHHFSRLYGSSRPADKLSEGDQWLIEHSAMLSVQRMIALELENKRTIEGR